jgi:hypothetical protein
MVYFMTLSFTDQREPNGSMIGELCTGKTSVRILESDNVNAVKLNKKNSRRKRKKSPNVNSQEKKKNFWICSQWCTG